MTLDYIKSEIYNLGFSTPDDVELSIVIQAINRALSTIASTVRPITNSFKISQYPIENQIKGYTFPAHYNGTQLSYTATGKTYSFECDGTGTVTVYDSSGVKTIDMVSNNEYKTYSGFCNGAVTIAFSGEFSYNVKNLAVYAEKTSNNPEDIPSPGNYKLYDFKKIAADKGETFLGFMNKYRISNGTVSVISDFDIIDRHIIRLSSDAMADYTIYYKKEYTHITEQTPGDMEMQLDSDLHVLIPLLAAFYVWQDDEQRKADKMYNDYETKRNDILARESKVVASVESEGF